MLAWNAAPFRDRLAGPRQCRLLAVKVAYRDAAEISAIPRSLQPVGFQRDAGTLGRALSPAQGPKPRGSVRQVFFPVGLPLLASVYQAHVHDQMPK